jgi:hypothetical protein
MKTKEILKRITFWRVCTICMFWFFFSIVILKFHGVIFEITSVLLGCAVIITFIKDIVLKRANRTHIP